MQANLFWLKCVNALWPSEAYGDIDLSQHWLRLRLVAWRYQAITQTNVDLSPKVCCGIHLPAISPNPQHVFGVIQLE